VISVLLLVSRIFIFRCVSNTFLTALSSPLGSLRYKSSHCWYSNYFLGMGKV